MSSPAALQAWATEAQSDPSLNCTLADDITLPVVTDGGSNWTPIQGYMGAFDGGGNTITGLTINKPTESSVGLFASIAEGGTVKNLTLDNVDITAKSYVGAVAGQNDGTIENCSVSGNVTTGNGLNTDSYVGGITGKNQGTITACHSSAMVEGIMYVGGITGKNQGTITACHSSATVEGKANVGGVVGDNSSTVTACYHATGNVTGNTTFIGGVAGWNSEYGTVTACYWNGTVTNDTGIGFDLTNVGDAQKVDEDWTEAMNTMNKALSGTGWQYVASSGDAPLTLQRQN